MQKAAHAYLQTQVTTTGQGDVVVLLYDGAIKFLNQAKDLLAVNDMAGKGINISKALDVIAELDSCLNMEKGGELAKNLHGLYDFCQNHLVKANIKKDPAMIDDVIRVLTGLRSAYAEILNSPEAQAAARETASTLGTKAISVSKKQPGISASAATAPQPGAGARMRASYAKASADFAQQGQQGAQAEERAASAPEEQEDQAGLDAGTKEAAKSVAPQKTPAEAAMMPPAGAGFGQRFGGSDMYRKYAAMQK